MKDLNYYGWNNYIQVTKNISYSSSEIGRVISIKGIKFILITEIGEIETELTGKHLFSLSKEDQPKVGDWVSYMDYGTQAFILEILPRVNTLFRQTSGKETNKQVIASNISMAIIIQGLDNDFNIMRLERYIVQILACGIKPAVVLNKADLIDNKNYYKNEVSKLHRDLPVHFCSTHSGYGIPLLKDEVFLSGNTYVFIGSSGVGKSSLINALENSDSRNTNSVSMSTGKGKHTTTTRDLFRIPNGSLIIDTPGMREFGIGFNEDYIEEDTFPVIHEFAQKCRYPDCKHLNEKGCAVIEAVATNAIDKVVYNSYLKLVKEQHYFEKSTAEKNREGKQFGKMTREAKNYRKKYKY